MEIKIGIIGPCDVVQAVMDVGQEFVGVLLEPLIYRNEEKRRSQRRILTNAGT